MKEGTNVITTTDREKRDEMFQEYRNSSEPNERQVVRFSGARPVEGSASLWESTYSIAYPIEVETQVHGSARNPKKFPGRKKDA